MREILTEFDELQEAMKKINLNEEVMPIYAGKVLINENAESYKKMQQILDCDEMRSSHKYLLNLNPEQMSEEEMDQVDKIFQLGVNRGFIDVDGEPEVEQAEVGLDVAEPEQMCCKAQKPAIGKVKIPCWTVMYSAFKNGEIKTGECYSNSIDARSAKADCLAKLSRCGYDNVSILALEQGDPDNCGFDDYGCNEEEKVEENDILKNRNHNNHIAEDEDLEEDDMLKSRPSNGAKHNGHVEEAEDDEEDSNERNAITGRLMNGRQRNSVDELADLPGEDDEDVEEAEVNEDALGDYVLTFEISDIDPETFLKGHVDQWIEDTLAKNPKVKIDKIGQTDVGVQVKVTGPYEQLEQIYADYLKYDDLYDFEKSPNDFDEFKASLEKVVESEDKIEESGNPYVAGMKTTDINGATAIGGSKSKKAAAPKKAKIDEDDEDSSDDSEEEPKEEEKADDSSDEGSEESNDEGSDDSDSDEGSDDEGSDDEGSEDDSGDNESSEDDDSEGSDDSEEDSEEESDDEGSDDSESDDDSEGNSDEGSEEEEDDSDDDSEEEEDSEDDDTEEDSEDDEEKKEELSDEEKADLKNDYKKAFKEVLFKCKFDDLCFDDLTIEQKVKFFTELGKKWKKNEPKDFMTDKEIEQLNKIVAKK